MKTIAVAGTLLVDKINSISNFPIQGQLSRINDVSVNVGGCVSNVSIDIKTLCPNINVSAYGRIGNDDNGRFLLSTLKNKGVNVDNIMICNNKTSFTEVMSQQGGERTFFSYAGANNEFCYDDMNFNMNYLHLGYFMLLDKIDNGQGFKILREAKKHDIITSIDCISSENADYSKVLPCLQYVDNLIINEIEAGLITNKTPNLDNIENICRILKSYGVRDRIIIHSKKWAVCFSDKLTILPSFDLPRNFIKGSTGAGDGFCSGALVAIMNNKSDMDILKIGCSVATMALSKEDAVSGLMNLEGCMDFCKNFARRKL